MYEKAPHLEAWRAEHVNKINNCSLPVCARNSHSQLSGYS